MKNLIYKVQNEPGLCTRKELDTVQKFLSALKSNLDIYISAKGTEPLGHTLEVELENINKYLNIVKK